MKCISASEAHAQTLKAFDKEYESILDMIGTRIDTNVKKGFFYTTVRINDYMLQHRVFTYLTNLGYKVSYLESKDIDDVMASLNNIKSIKKQSERGWNTTSTWA